MTRETTQALKFLNSMRGQYIVSQALYHAIQTMEKVPAPHTEVSNIEDMKYLMDNLFPIFKSVAATKEKLHGN
jgi:ethanolamine utilization protein EutP (predicted NTPase)